MLEVTDNTDTIVQELQQGRITALPTETVYGLAADANNISAVEQIFKAKNRPQDHPLIIHVSGISMAQQYAQNIPDYALRLMEHYWPGPLTLVLPKSDLTNSTVTGGQDTVALRSPAHPLFLDVIAKLGRGLVAPSANKYGHISTTSAKHVYKEFHSDINDKFNYILDGGNCSIGIESTIIDATHIDSFKILRPGILSASELEQIAGVRCMLDSNSNIRVSGAKLSHYSPNKPVYIVNQDIFSNIVRDNLDKKILFICNNQGLLKSFVMHQYCHPALDARAFEIDPDSARRALDRDDNLNRSCASHNGISNYFVGNNKLDIKLYNTVEQLALNLYEWLRYGEADFDMIMIDEPPKSEQWHALWDRISKAAFRYS